MILFEFTVGAGLRTSSLLFVETISVISSFAWYKITNNKIGEKPSKF
jgi:hypothetical protein